MKIPRKTRIGVVKPGKGMTDDQFAESLVKAVSQMLVEGLVTPGSQPGEFIFKEGGGRLFIKDFEEARKRFSS